MQVGVDYILSKSNVKQWRVVGVASSNSLLDSRAEATYNDERRADT
jgi:hypothetical protein